MSRWLLSLLLLATVLLGQATSATFHVAKPPAGDDSRTCTQAQSASTPRASINKGIQCMSGGDTVLIGDGTYPELLTTFDAASVPGFPYVFPIPNGSLGAPTRIHAANARQVILQFANDAQIGSSIVVGPGKSHIEFQGLVLDGQDNSASAAVGIETGDGSTGMRFLNMLIRETRGIAVSVEGTDHVFLSNDFEYTAQLPDGTSTCPSGTCLDPSNPTCIGYCHCYYLFGSGHLVDGGTYKHASGFVYHQAGGSSAMVFRNGQMEDVFGVGLLHGGSTLYNTTAYHLHVGVVMSPGSTVVHNTFTHSRTVIPAAAWGTFLQQNTAGTVSTIKNNLLFDFTPGSGVDFIHIEDGSGNNVLASGSHSNVQGNVCQYTQNGCITASAGSNFVANAPAGNFNLPATSPAISAGVNPGAGFTPDQAGNVRPQASFDAGAREFMAGDPPAATALEFAQQPSSTEEDVIIAPAITVRVIDQYGAPFSSTALVTMAISLNPGSATLGGDTTKNVSGLSPATFNDLSLNNPGTGYTLAASSPGLTSAISTAFTITPSGSPPVATAVQFVNVLGPVPEDEIFGVSVRVIDQFGVLFPSAAAITLALGANPGGSTLSGTLVRNASAGLVVFDDLVLNNPATDYTLVASSPGLTSGTSTAFPVTPVGTPPAQLLSLPALSGLFLGH